ncbi:MAG TPA: hypothetical protein VHC22_31700 [Pirellulales bacterium]|nr:hypothetical protein [Pirellulales bacterium]
MLEIIFACAASAERFLQSSVQSGAGGYGGVRSAIDARHRTIIAFFRRPSEWGWGGREAEITGFSCFIAIFGTRAYTAYSGQA